MLAKAVVVDSLDFDKWLADLQVTGNLPDHPGLVVMQANTCLTCHTLDGTKVIGPTFKGLYGRKTTVVTESGEKEVEANDDYIIRSIEDPNAEVVKGYNRGLMQPYKDKISKEDLQKIVDYFKTNASK
jgi:cytochrome c oxidase subunit 2